MAEAIKKAIEAEVAGMEADELRKQVEDLQKQLNQKEEILDGVADGQVRCLQDGCDYGVHDAKFTRDEWKKYFKDERGNLTDRVENSTTYWHLRDQDPNCPKCDYPLNHLHPGAYAVPHDPNKFKRD
jgi:cell division septum initiation protein DivIVA